jgi:Zn-dependent oligopeptidase
MLKKKTLNSIFRRKLKMTTAKYERCVVRLSTEDKEELAALAEKEGLSISDFIRSKALEPKKQPTSTKDAALANLTIMTYAIANHLAKEKLQSEDISKCLETAKGIADQLNIKFAFDA